MEFKNLRTQVQNMQTEIASQNNQMKHLIEFLKKNSQSTSRLHLKSKQLNSQRILKQSIQEISPIQNNEQSQNKIQVNNQELQSFNQKNNQIKNSTQKYKLNYSRPYNLSKSIGKCHSCKLIQSVTLNQGIVNQNIHKKTCISSNKKSILQNKSIQIINNSKNQTKTYRTQSRYKSCTKKSESLSMINKSKKSLNNISKQSIKQNKNNEPKWKKQTENNIKKNLRNLFQKKPNKIKISQDINQITSRQKLN